MGKREAAGYEVALVCGEFVAIETNKETGKHRVIEWSPGDVFQAKAMNDDGEAIISRCATTVEKAKQLLRNQMKEIDRTGKCFQVVIRKVVPDLLKANAG